MSETGELQPMVVRNKRGLSINGTRITLYDLMDYLHAGLSPEEIQEWLPLTEQEVAAFTLFRRRDKHRIGDVWQDAHSGTAIQRPDIQARDVSLVGPDGIENVDTVGQEDREAVARVGVALRECRHRNWKTAGCRDP